MMTEEAQIVAGDGILDTLGDHLRSAGLDGKVHVISDRQVWSHVGPTLAAGLTERGFAVRTKTIAGGEHAKTLREAEALYTWLAAERAERRDTIVALGGGVVGDLVGFVAATYLRGVALVQVPTSVLAQVDSAIGGKTAVDLPAGKNLVGAFHEARITLIDTRTLDTLPARDLRAGWAEVLKTTLLFDPPLFERLEGYDAPAVPADLRREVVARCATWKQKLVREDPKERGPRMLLNLGHTIGHALEAATGYTRYVHGEAVAIGLVGAAWLSAKVGGLPSTEADRIEAALQRSQLPVRYDEVTPEAVWRAAQSDKKVSKSTMRWILLEAIGRPVIRQDVPEAAVHRVLADLRAT